MGRAEFTPTRGQIPRGARDLQPPLVYAPGCVNLVLNSIKLI